MDKRTEEIRERKLYAQARCKTPGVELLFGDMDYLLERIGLLEKALKEECEYHGYGKWSDMWSLWTKNRQAAFKGDAPNMAAWLQEQEGGEVKDSQTTVGEEE